MNRDYRNLRKVVLGIGLFLVGISLYCSFLLYTGFSDNLSDKAAWGGMGLGLDMFKNVALLAAFALWTLELFAARVVAVVVGLAYVVLSVLSFTAFFGFMSGVQHQLEKGALLASSRYEAAKAAVEHAEQQVRSLSRHADPAGATQAQAKLAEINARIAAAQQDMSAYAYPDCTPKRDSRGNPFSSRAAEACNGLKAIQAEARPYQAQSEGHAQYQAALAHRQQVLQELAQLDSGEVETGGGLHPMFADLGRLLAVAPDEAKVAFMFVSSASAEILGTLSVLIASLLGRRRSFTLDEIEALSGQLQAQQLRLHHALNLAQIGGVPPVKPSPMPAPATPKERLPGMGAARAAQDAPRRREWAEAAWDAPREAEPAYTPQEIRIPDPDVLYQDLTDAILRGECPPQAQALVERYRLPYATARRYLSVLARQGIVPS